MNLPEWDKMDAHQRWACQRRLELESEIWSLKKQLGGLIHDCRHVIIKGYLRYRPDEKKIDWSHEGKPNDWNDGCCGASCAICGEEFGWWCPKNPKGYCEYDNTNWYGCKFCGQPDERK